MTTHVKSSPRVRPSQELGREPPIPVLESGDRLTRQEFHRRYEAMPHVKKAELIEGVVYMGPRVSAENHGNPHFCLIGWLGVYCAGTPGIEGSDNGTVILDDINEPQPDISLRIARDGGQSKIVENYIQGPPEWVGEVAASSASYDLHDKFEAYRRNGVHEYLVWRVLDQAIDWFVLRDGQYQILAAGPDGITRSEVFPGLWLDATAMLARNLARVLEVLQQGLASPEHAQFVEKLLSGNQ
ncbi:MAG: Uma2 family endonuclease [Planctomycetales bacterium]